MILNRAGVVIEVDERLMVLFETLIRSVLTRLTENQMLGLHMATTMEREESKRGWRIKFVRGATLRGESA